MLEQLMSLAQSQLGSQFDNNPQLQQLGVNPQQAAGVVSESVMESLMQQLQSGDFSGVQEMLSGQDTTPDNPAVNGLMPNVASQLGSKLNLSPGTAQMIASIAIPLIMNMLNGRVNQAQQGGMDIGGLLGGLMGGGQQSAGGGLLGSVLGGMMGGGGAPAQQPARNGQDMLGSILGGLFK